MNFFSCILIIEYIVNIIELNGGVNFFIIILIINIILKCSGFIFNVLIVGIKSGVRIISVVFFFINILINNRSKFIIINSINLLLVKFIKELVIN